MVVETIIQPAGDAKIYELRMSGKSRLYYIAHRSKNGALNHIVILGSHGDSQQDQRKFLNTIVKNPDDKVIHRFDTSK